MPNLTIINRKSVAVVIGLERQPVGTKAVVIDMGEIVKRRGPIRDGHATAFQECNLLFEGGRGLVVLHLPGPKKVTPHGAPI